MTNKHTVPPTRGNAEKPNRYLSLVVAMGTAVLVSGCGSSIGNMTTSSLFGANPAQQQAQAAAGTTNTALPAQPAAPQSTPAARAMHVGALTARAVKCGYNFDPGQLKAAFFASEAARGTQPNQTAVLEQAYNVSFNGVNKVATTEPNYCNKNKTKKIKADLTRALAGDFAPPAAPKKVAEQNDGIFGSLFDPDAVVEEKGPAYGSQDWWDKQADKAGR